MGADRGPDGLGKESDYKSTGMGGMNLFVLYFLVFAVVAGVGAGLAALLFSRQHRGAAMYWVRSYNLGPLYLSILFIDLCWVLMAANLATKRRLTRCNVPDQHVFRVYGGGPADGALVLMNDEGPFGPFNRSQRALGNFVSHIPLTLAFIVLVGFVFPWTALVLAVLFGLCRVRDALEYSQDRRKHGLSYGVGCVVCGLLDGMAAYVGIRALM